MNIKPLFLAVVLAVATICAAATAPIIIRHDRSDAAYLDLGRRYAAVLGHVRTARGNVNGTATLIAPRWVATAAHVARSLRPGQALEIGGASYAVDRVFVHPAWDGPAPAHDIALVRLGRAVEGVEPARLYRQDDEAGREVVVVGAGMVGTGLTGPREDDGQVRGATNRIDEAAETWLRFVFDAPDSENTTDLEGISGPGDSGGPAFIVIDGAAYLAGVSSGQDDAATGGKPGRYGVSEYYTRVSHYTAWIDQTMRAPDAAGAAADPDALPPAAAGQTRTVTRQAGPAQGEGSGAWGLPDSPTGRALKALLNTIAQGDDAAIRAFVETHLDDAFQNNFSMDEHLGFFRQLHEALPDLDLAQVNKTSPTSVNFILVSGQTGHRVKGRFALEAQPPHRFTDLGFEPTHE